jgi:hypothetical protein
MRYIGLIVLVLALAACGSSHPGVTPKAASKLATTAPSSGATPTTAAPTGASCGSQVTSWLAEPDGSGISANTVQHDITSIVFDAKAYQKYGPSDTGARQNFLNFLNTLVTNLTYTSTPNAPPTCADPAGLWGADVPSGTFLGDAGSAGNDTPGTSQADSDVQAILTDFKNLNAELAKTSGVQAKGYTGTV